DQLIAVAAAVDQHAGAYVADDFAPGDRVVAAGDLDTNTVAQGARAGIIADEVAQQLVAVCAAVNPHPVGLVTADDVGFGVGVVATNRIVTSLDLDAVAAVSQCAEAVGVDADGVAYHLIAVGGAVEEYAVPAITGDEVAGC